MQTLDRLNTLALVTALALSSGCAEEASPHTAGENAAGLQNPFDLLSAAPTVLFFGDSLGAGLHLEQGRAFPWVLQRTLSVQGTPFRLISTCESGRTTADGVAAIEWALQTRPDLVVVELGGNDGLHRVPLEEIEENLRTIAEASLARGAEVLLLGMRLPGDHGDYAEGHDAIYARLAAELEIGFVPYFMRGVGGVPEMNLEDGLHPNAEGQERLAKNVRSVFAEMVAELSGR